MTESVLTTFDKVLPEFGLPIPDASPAHRSSYVLPNGSKFIFLALDDPQRSQSVEVDGGDISEGVEIDRPDRALALAGAMRFHGVEVPFRQMFIDCNPGTPGHWLNKLGEFASDDLRVINTPEQYRRTLAFNRAPVVGEGKIKRIITSLPDNPGYFDTAAWSLTKNGQEYIDGLGYLTPYMKSRWVDGLWVAAEGIVFPEFRRKSHVIANFEPPPEWPSILCYDPGFGVTGCLWICLAPSGDIYVYDEIYEGGKSMHAHCAEIIKRNQRYGRNVLKYFGDPNEMFSNRAQGPSCAQQAKEAGLRFIPWPRDAGAAFDAGVEAIRHHLGPPAKLFVCERCTGLIGNFESWAFKKNARGEILTGADQYEEQNDHALDCLRGGLQTGFLQRMARAMAGELVE